MKNIILILVIVFLVSCSKSDETVSQGNTETEMIEIPSSTVDYNSLENWYFHPSQGFNFLRNYNLNIAIIDKNLNTDSVIEIQNNSDTNTGIDVFWVHPTELTNPPAFPTTVPIANQNTTFIGGITLAQGALLAKYGRFYAPKYRQATPASFLDFNFTEEERAVGLLEAYSDIKASFLHYLENFNNGNKIILAGHSQGSFLLAMLVRDVFDNNPELQDKLITASLGGMGYVYSSADGFNAGWWENIKLCEVTNECGCVHFWRSYKEETAIPEPNMTLPSFSKALVNIGLVFRATDINNDIFYQDSSFYHNSMSPMRYITPGASYNFANGYNYLAFDNMYTARFKRESNVKVGLAVDDVDDPLDQRPRELDNLQSPIIFSEGDLHIKDYHIYIWALLEQIDEKISNCE